MFQSLTESQAEAVRTIEGPLLILAGPGSGKTRVVTHRTAYMVQQGIHPRRILTLTFTNKAADEMRTRLLDLVPNAEVWTSTFHRFCSKTLREFGGYVGLEENFTILDASDSLKALKQTVEEHDVELYKYSESQILSRISELKNQLVTPEDFQPRPGVPIEAVASRIYPQYQRRLLLSNSVDFDDLLMHVAKLLMDNPEVRTELDARHQFISVDEYQDTNYAQYMILKMLSVDHRNLAATGDPDQSIYGWRGANIRNILDFEHDFPETRIVKLEQNYRSTPNILEVADRLIEYNSQRKQKNLFTEKPAGNRVRLVAYPSQQEEANHIAEQIQQQISRGQRRPRDFAIFYRTNALSRNLEHALRSAGIPFQVIKGHEFYQRKEIKDVLAYLHLIHNPRNDVAFERIINVPTRKIGKVTIDRLKHYAQGKGICLMEAAWNCDQITSLKGNAKKNVKQFAEMMVGLRGKATDLVASVITHVYLETGYRDVLLTSGNPEDEERAANLDELLTAAHEFDLEYGELGGLDAYLDQSSLVNDVDAWDTDDDKVTLMTLHAAKGLEFPSVFIVALEDGILPHSRSMDSDSDIEEERRLLFVGITRAMQDLQISRALYRPQRGRSWPTIPSTFLMELPRESMDVHEPGRYQAWQEDGDNGDDYEYGFGDPESLEDFEQVVYDYSSESDTDAEDDDVPFDVFVDTNDDALQSPASSGKQPLDDPADVNAPDTSLAVPFDQLSDTDEVQAESDSDNDGDPDHDGEFDGNTNHVSEDHLPIDAPAAGRRAAMRKGGSRQVPQIQTARQLLADAQPEASSSDGIRLPANKFRENMLVDHPSYGVGRIVTISRAGSKPTAQVEFVSAGTKKFVLTHCPLRPVVE